MYVDGRRSETNGGNQNVQLKQLSVSFDLAFGHFIALICLGFSLSFLLLSV